MTRMEEKATLNIMIQGLSKELEKYSDVKTSDLNLSKQPLLEVFFGNNSIAAKLSYVD